jgi:CHAT domain-containing protein
MSRRYMSENLSVAKYLDERPQGTKVKVLLVVNPTADLPGAQKEGDTVHKLFSERTDTDVVRLERAQATRKALLAELTSGRYDLVHYAGHAFFDAELPARSGLLCHNDEPLTGVDLASIGNLPKLVFFNACESGRVRRRRPNQPPRAGKKQARPSKPDLRRERIAPAEAYLRGGVANFIGTYWPVGDSAAEMFSKRFYEELLKGETLGDAVLRARRDVHAIQSVDWSDYIHYGDYRFRLR